jgi:hypothetical protein
MVSEDQAMRKRAMKTGVWHSEVDKKNTKELKKIISKHGWPTISMVGKRASFCAWLLAQHADHDKRFQKKALKLLKKIYSKNWRDVDPMNIAFLTDRILVGNGKKQIFGTQFYMDKSGALKPYPIRNKSGLDERRKKYGIPPFKEYLKSIKNFKVKYSKCK